MKDCQFTLGKVMPSASDPRKIAISAFAKSCVASVDTKFFIKAIMAAQCPKGVKKPSPHTTNPVGAVGAPALKCGAPACEYQYSGISGTTVAALTNSAKFRAGKPDKTLQLTDWHQGSGYFQMTMRGNNLGAMLEGYLLAPATGKFTFSTNSDDSSELWGASKPNTKIGLVKVVELRGCCRKVQGTKALSLTKGKSYYMRYYVKEGGGGECKQLPDW